MPTCVQCGADTLDSTLGTIIWGKEQTTGQWVTYTKLRTTTRYTIAGRRSEWVCSNCLKSERINHIVVYLMGGLALVIGGYLLIGLLGGVGGFVLLILLVGGAAKFFQGITKDELASAVVRKEVGKPIKEQGYKIWSPKQYESVRKGEHPL